MIRHILFLGLLLFSWGALFGQSVNEKNIDRSFEINIDCLHIIDAVQYVIQKTKLPIDFECESLDSKIQGLTAHQIKSKLLLKGSSQKLCSSEERKLKDATEVEARFPNSVLDWDLPKVSKRITAPELADVVNQICELYPDYMLKLSNGHFLIFPKKSILDFRMDPLSIKNQTLGEAIGTISPQLEKHGIMFISLARSSALNRKIERLELPDSSAREVLTRLVQSVGPDVIWYLGGVKDSRTLTISTLK